MMGVRWPLGTSISFLILNRYRGFFSVKTGTSYIRLVLTSLTVLVSESRSKIFEKKAQSEDWAFL